MHTHIHFLTLFFPGPSSLHTQTQTHTTHRGSPPAAEYRAPILTVVCAGNCGEVKRNVSGIARGVPPPPSTWLRTCVSSSHLKGGGALTAGGCACSDLRGGVVWAGACFRVWTTKHVRMHVRMHVCVCVCARVCVCVCVGRTTCAGAHPQTRAHERTHARADTAHAPAHGPRTHMGHARTCLALAMRVYRHIQIYRHICTYR